MAQKRETMVVDELAAIEAIVASCWKTFKLISRSSSSTAASNRRSSKNGGTRYYSVADLSMSSGRTRWS